MKLSEDPRARHRKQRWSLKESSELAKQFGPPKANCEFIPEQLSIDWTYNFEQLDHDAAIMASNLGIKVRKPSPKQPNPAEVCDRNLPMPRPPLSYDAFTRCYYREPTNGELLPACSNLRPYAFACFVKLHLPLLLYTELADLDFTQLLDRWYIIGVMMEENVKLPTFYLSLEQAVTFLGQEILARRFA